MRAFLTSLVAVVLIGGIGFIVIWFAIYSIFGADSESMLLYLPSTLVVFGGLSFVIALGMRSSAADKDEENYLIARATPLPIKLAAALDDAWVRGKLVCEKPLTSPHFNLPCVHFEYKLEESQWSYTGSRPRKRWVVKQELKESAPFGVKDATGHLQIVTADARFEQLVKREDKTKSQRHTLRYLPVDGEVSAVGTVSDDRASLTKEGDTPLLITPQAREEWLQLAERGEATERSMGLLTAWVSLAALAWGIGALADWLPQPVTGLAGLWAPMIGSAVLVLLWWLIATLNRLVAYRQRIAHAWGGIDVDLSTRYDLVKNLVETVKEHAAHEASTFEAIAAWRSGGEGVPEALMVQAQAGLDQLTRTLRVTVEANPELQTQELTAKLMDQLTGLEEKLAHGRITYNECVREYNDLVETFPTVLLAKVAGHSIATPWAIADANRDEVAAPPQVTTTDAE